MSGVTNGAHQLHPPAIGASRHQAGNNSVRGAVLGREDNDAALRRATLAARPLAAGGDCCHHRDRELRLAESGLARDQCQFAERDAPRPQPLDRLRRYIRRALRDQC